MDGKIHSEDIDESAEDKPPDHLDTLLKSHPRPLVIVKFTGLSSRIRAYKEVNSLRKIDALFGSLPPEVRELTLTLARLCFALLCSDSTLATMPRAMCCAS